MSMTPLIVHGDDEERFVGVRIPVAVNSQGRWFATGRSDWDRDDAFRIVTENADMLDMGSVDVQWVYAQVPLYEHRVFPGDVRDKE